MMMNILYACMCFFFLFDALQTKLTSSGLDVIIEKMKQHIKSKFVAVGKII